MSILDDLINAELIPPGQGGGDVTPGSVATAIASMSSLQKDSVREAIGASSVPVVTSDLSSTSITLSAEDNHIYEYGELASLTISSFPVSGNFIICFVSGSTATTLTVPETLIMPDNFTPAANTQYEISVYHGYALCAGWNIETT